MRVVVTGIGMVTGLGMTREQSWEGLKRGEHSFKVLDLPAYAGSHGFIGSPIPRRDRSPVAIALKAATEAIEDAGIRISDGLSSRFSPIDASRIATVIGTSKGDLIQLSEALGKRATEGHSAERPLSNWFKSWPNTAAAAVSMGLNLQGPCLSPVAACATGLIAAIQGAALIGRGTCDVALVGAADASLGQFVLGAFRNMRVLARDDQEVGRGVRPWDRRRSGFLVGEGAAVIILESEAHARGRGVVPYAEFAGGTFGADAYHITTLNPDPTNLAALIRRSLENARVDPSEIDHVNVHGTATRTNDPLECQAIRRALGVAADDVSCSANKAQVGHLLGAAGAVELAFTVLAVCDGFVPPTMNLDDRDPLCDLDGTPNVGRSRAIRAALKLSIGFGGHLAAAVVRRVEPSRLAVTSFTL